ncbi:MAG TPA: gfo/Idh/MocA family oxidoreductase, partial [Planctomycetaceae bacterium]|nr:gfo/Idh/MocA family oxidoreductase [Planctomycetaceae bacterium]
MNRRSFLTGSAGFGGMALAQAALAAPTPAGKSEASERVQVGCVGVKGRAGFLLSAFAERKDVDVVAIADVDSRQLPTGIEAVEKLHGRRPRAETDFRRLIDDPKIDVLVVGTPDHWHA